MPFSGFSSIATIVPVVGLRLGGYQGARQPTSRTRSASFRNGWMPVPRCSGWFFGKLAKAARPPTGMAKSTREQFFCAALRLRETSRLGDSEPRISGIYLQSDVVVFTIAVQQGVMKIWPKLLIPSPSRVRK